MAMITVKMTQSNHALLAMRRQNCLKGFCSSNMNRLRGCSANRLRQPGENGTVSERMGARLRNVPMEELAVSARNRGARARGCGGKDAGDDRSRAVIHRGIEPERRIDRVESMSIESAIERSRPVGVRALTTARAQQLPAPVVEHRVPGSDRLLLYPARRRSPPLIPARAQAQARPLAHLQTRPMRPATARAGVC